MDTYTIIPQAAVPPSRAGYILPFRDVPVRISQGYNGPISHVLVEIRDDDIVFQQDDRFSLDFAVPLGTAVIAAKKGRVRSAYDNSDQYYQGLELVEGLGTIVNTVTLFHDDGTATLYSHLAKGSVLVRDGMVEQGQLLAVTGMSGWIGPEPHLHFAALRYVGVGCRATFPVDFDNYHGPLEHKVLMGDG